MADAEEIKTVIRAWVGLDDESRNLLARQKAIREEKARLSESILGFMRNNQVDNLLIIY